MSTKIVAIRRMCRSRMSKLLGLCFVWYKYNIIKIKIIPSACKPMELSAYGLRLTVK